MPASASEPRHFLRSLTQGTSVPTRGQNYPPVPRGAPVFRSAHQPAVSSGIEYDGLLPPEYPPPSCRRAASSGAANPPPFSMWYPGACSYAELRSTTPAQNARDLRVPFPGCRPASPPLHATHPMRHDCLPSVRRAPHRVWHPVPAPA